MSLPEIKAIAGRLRMNLLPSMWHRLGEQIRRDSTGLKKNPVARQEASEQRSNGTEEGQRHDDDRASNR